VFGVLVLGVGTLLALSEAPGDATGQPGTPPPW